jgi:hypothetical protein
MELSSGIIKEYKIKIIIAYYFQCIFRIKIKLIKNKTLT